MSRQRIRYMLEPLTVDLACVYRTTPAEMAYTFTRGERTMILLDHQRRVAAAKRKK